MKKWTLLASLAVLAGVTFALVPQLAADHHEQGEMTAEEKAEMEKWMKLAQPGEAHAHMAKFAGSFDATITSWMTPDAPPSETVGKSENKMILGGRYLLQKYTGDMMGQPFEGYGLMAFDNYKKEYVSIWCDNWSTMIMTMTGTEDESGATTLTGTIPDPETGKDIVLKSISTMKDDNTFLYEMYRQDPGGEEFKNMVITYTRTGGSAKKAGY
jgi:hypothetical protein